MHANKLRENNYIVSNGIVVQCTISDLMTIKAANIINQNVTDRQYILFNNEWCKRFQWQRFMFGESEGFFIELNGSVGLMQLSFEASILSISINGDEIDLPHIKYVHEVQNLYNDLTGKELELYDEWSNVKVLIGGKEVEGIKALTFIPKER